MGDEHAPGHLATIEAWRSRGAQHADPVRFRFIEALARRAAAQEGEARRLLDERVARLLAAYGEHRGQAGAPAAEARGLPRAPTRGPLAELVEHIACHAPAAAVAVQGGEPAAPGLSSAPPELKALSYFRRTWSRLSADQRLTQSLAKVPENAGPLHSHQLVHRALTLMRTLSPDYLDRFMPYVDALLWLDQAGSGSAGSPGPRKRP
ncbi:DUF2894 domain-containing protein [Aquincola sp. MAHUQ-54]|uniref:DUF2894 domain-containing protein n=1 Tax=Aquincola agrisoli TaxID=3119538 RepID=A0AAW9QB59_9BURK